MPEAPAAPAPAAAPAAPAAPAKAAAPAAKPGASAEAPEAPPEAKPGSAFDETFAEIDALAKKPEPAKPKDDKEKEKPPAAAKPGDKEKPADKPPEEPAHDLPLKDLRKAYATFKAENETLKKQLAERAEKPVTDAERKEIAERVATAEKRRDELETAIKFKDYSRSDEYQKQYVAPMKKASAAMIAEVGRMMLTDPETGDQRQVTKDDLARLVDLDTQPAAKLAREWFGDVAPEVLAHRRKIIDLHQASREALEKYQTEGADIEKRQQEERAAAHEASAKMFTTLNTEAVTKYPEFFGPDDADPDGNKLLEQGFAMADMAFSNDPRLTVEQRIKLHSQVRNRAAGFARMVHRNRQIQAKLDEVTKELEEFKKSEPGGGDGSRANNGAPLTFEQEIDALVRAS
jgi:hypothetical protein